MSDTFRCINAFSYGTAVYPGGMLVEDGDPILETHRTHFAQVGQPSVVLVSETTSAAPGEGRTLTTPEIEALTAWLAAEETFNAAEAERRRVELAAASGSDADAAAKAAVATVVEPGSIVEQPAPGAAPTARPARKSRAPRSGGANA